MLQFITLVSVSLYNLAFFVLIFSLSAQNPYGVYKSMAQLRALHALKVHLECI